MGTVRRRKTKETEGGGEVRRGQHAPFSFPREDGANFFWPLCPASVPPFFPPQKFLDGFPPGPDAAWTGGGGGRSGFRV